MMDLNPIDMNVDLKKLTQHIAQENSLTRDYKTLKKENQTTMPDFI